eukprot:11239391-Prorocentrum_lima.AAC.1
MQEFAGERSLLEGPLSVGYSLGDCDAENVTVAPDDFWLEAAPPRKTFEAAAIRDLDLCVQPAGIGLDGLGAIE